MMNRSPKVVLTNPLTSCKQDRIHDGMIIARSGAGNAVTEASDARLPLRTVERVTVSVPARLHLGFVDLNSDMGRRFGNVGIAIDKPHTRVVVGRNERTQIEGPNEARTQGYLEALIHRFNLDRRLHLRVADVIPNHVDLGSDTQLELAIGATLSH